MEQKKNACETTHAGREATDNSTDKTKKKTRYVCVSSVCIGVVEMTMMEKDIVVDLGVLLLPRSTQDAAALLGNTRSEFPPQLLAGAVSPAALALVVTVHSSALGLSTGARTPLLLLHLLFLLHRKWAVDGELVVLLALAGVDVEVPPWFWSDVPHADVGVLGGRRRRGAVDGEGCKGTAGILGAILYLANVRVYGGGRGDRAGAEFDCDGGWERSKEAWQTTWKIFCERAG